MNLPNRLTLLRILLVPFFIFFLLWQECPHHFLIALIIFIGASLTDLLDGKIARKYNMVTDFGKFMDPIADKLLICAAFVGFVELGFCSSWVVIFILAREFAVSSLRMIAARDGKVIAANIWGKIKTVAQMTVTIFIMLIQELCWVGWVPNNGVVKIVQDIASWAVVVLTIVSGAIYVYQNRKFLDYRK